MRKLGVSAALAVAIVLSIAVLGAGQSRNPSLLYTRSDISGHDISCNQATYDGRPLSYCQLSNGLANAEDACRINPSCQSVTSDGYSFYLKNSTGPRIYKEGWVVIVTNTSSLHDCVLP